MATRRTQLHDARAHFHAVLVLHDIPNACLAALDGVDVQAACTPILDGRVIAERAPSVRARSAA
jgi:hypothetical protein